MEDMVEFKHKCKIKLIPAIKQCSIACCFSLRFCARADKGIETATAVVMQAVISKQGIRITDSWKKLILVTGGVFDGF